MSDKVIRYNIIQDFVDRTPADVLAANPGLFSSASEVPEYLYKSLKTLWLGSSASSGEFAERVAQAIGSGDSDARGGIQIVQATTVLSHFSEDPILQSDELNSENADIIINIRNPRSVKTTDLLDNTVQRLKYILDMHYRSYRGLYAGLVVSGDLTISPNSPYFCRFVEYGTANRTSDIQVLFRVNYGRVYAR